MAGRRRRWSAIRQHGLEVLESRVVLTPGFGFNYTTIASNLSSTHRFFGSPNAEDAPFTVLRYGHGQMTSLTEIGAGFLDAENITFEFGSNDTAEPVEALTLVSFDNGLTTGLSKQVYRPDADDVPTLTIYASGVPMVEGRVKEVALEMNASRVVSSTRSTFLVERAVGADTRLYDQLFAASQGTGEVPFNLSPFDAMGPWLGIGDAMIFSSTGTSLFEAASNRAPTDLSISASSILENRPAGTAIGNLTTVDPDGPGQFTYSLVAGAGSTDNASFRIDGNQLKSNASFNFELKNSYSVRVQTTDAGGKSYSEALTITVSDVNEMPTDVKVSSASIQENQPVGTIIGTLSTIDPDAPGQFTYTLIATGFPDNAAFRIEGNQLKSNAVFSAQRKQSYSIGLGTKDAGGLTLLKTMVITITKASAGPNRAPTDLQLAKTEFPEHHSHDYDLKRTGKKLLTSLFTVDPDGDRTFAYSLVEHATYPDNHSFVIEKGLLYARREFDFESQNTFRIGIKTEDQGKLSLTKPILISIQNNEEITLSSNQIKELAPSGTIVGTLGLALGYHPLRGTKFAYSLVEGPGGEDNSLFDIENPIEGKSVLRSKSVFDFEQKNQYRVRVQAKNDITTLIDVLRINVVDVESAPTEMRLSSTRIAENLPEDTPVGVLSASGGDTQGPYRYHMDVWVKEGQHNKVFRDNQHFTISGDKLYLKKSADFESRSSYRILVSVHDEKNRVYRHTFDINITDVNEAPTDIQPLFPGPLQIVENTFGPSVRLRALDPDRRDAFEWQLVDGDGDDDNSLFFMQGNQLFYDGYPDYEEKQTLAVRVRCTDEGGNSIEKPLKIAVRDVQELEDQYLVGDWDGDGKDTFAVRRGKYIYYQATINSLHGIKVSFGDGRREDEYLVGDWDGDGKDTLAVRRGNQILYQPTITSTTGIPIAFGEGRREDQYLVGDWDGDGKDTLAVRRGNRIYYQHRLNSTSNTLIHYGTGRSEDQYLVGDWDGDGKDTFAVRRNNRLLNQPTISSRIGKELSYGNGRGEREYLVGSFFGDRKSTFVVRRRHVLIYQTSLLAKTGVEVGFGNG